MAFGRTVCHTFGMAIDYKLSKGSHKSRADGMCAMEWVSYIAGESHSDSPKCVDPALNRFGVSLNDCLPDDLRQQLRPYLARMIGTAGDGMQQQRLWMLADWAVRVATAEAMEATKQPALAAMLRAVPKIVDKASALYAKKVARAVGDAAASASAAASGAAAAAAASAASAYYADGADADADADAADAYYHTAAAAADAYYYYAADGGWETLLPSALELLDRMLPTETVTLPETEQKEYDRLLEVTA